jgi:hypothetical protein
LPIFINDFDSPNSVNTFNTPEPIIEPDIIGEFIPSYTEPKSKQKEIGFSGMYTNLPCVADYGSLIGDNVCNGEIGLLEDPGLICPYNKPICNYKCGSTFGTCSYSN